MRNLIFIFLSLFFTSQLFSCSKPGDLTIQRAVKAYQKQNYEEALSLFKDALKEESNYSPETLYNFITNIYLRQDDLESAVVYQEKIVQLRDDCRNLLSLGMNYHLLGRDEESENTYKKAAQLFPENAEPYASLGSLYLGQEKYQLALDNLQKAAKIEEKIAVIHGNLALAYAGLGDEENTLEELKKAKELKCENYEEFQARAEEFFQK